MEYRKNNGIYWGLLIVICFLIGISFWERKEIKREMELRVLREVTYSLVKEKLYSQAWSYVSSYQLDDQKNIDHYKNFVKNEAQRERQRIWISLKKTWQTTDAKQREKNLDIVTKARQHQLLDNITFFDEKVLQLPKLKKATIPEKRLAEVEKKVMAKAPEKTPEVVLPKAPQQIQVPQKKLTIAEQLAQDWEELLAKEKPAVRGTLKEIEKHIQIKNNWRYMFRGKGKNILTTRSKALIPLMLSTMSKKFSRDYYSLQYAAKILTILTGKEIKFTRYKTAQELEKLVAWWIKDKDKITIDYKSWDRQAKDNCIQQILEVTTTNNSYYSSFYRENAKFRSLKSVLDMLQKETSYRPFVDVKCVPEMIPQLLEQTSGQRWWGLVHIFRNMYKEGHFDNIDKIVDSDEHAAMARFICVLALWKNGKTFSASQLFAIAQQEKNAMNQALMIMVLRHAENTKDVIPQLLRKLDQSDNRLQQAICYALEEYKPTKEQRFIFTPYLPAIEKMLIYSLNDNRVLCVLANISSRQATEILISYVEKVYRNPKQKHILSQGLKYVKQATSASWNTHKYYENNYQIAKKVIQDWRGVENKEKAVELHNEKITWKKDLPQGKTTTIKGEKQMRQSLINSTLRSVKSGDIVELTPGEYYGNFTIPAGVTFRGSSPNSVQINGTITLLSKSTLENITIHSSHTPVVVKNASGALVKNCWIKGVTGRTGIQNTSAIFIQNSSGVVLMQNVVYDVGVDSPAQVMAIHMQQSSGIITNNIVGRIIAKNNPAYAIHIEDCKAVRVYNNTIAHVKSTNSSGYGIYIDSASSTLVENNIVYSIIGKESYGVVNQSNSTQVQYNTVFDAQLPYVGESHSNHIRNPVFTNDREGNFTLQATSPCLAIANIDAKPNVAGIEATSFVNQLGALGGHNVFDKKYNEFLQKFTPQKGSAFQQRRNIWMGYSGRMLKKYLHELRDPLKKMRAKIQIKRYKQTAVEVLQMIVDRKGPAEFRGLEVQARQILSEMKREMKIGSWSFGK
ncbi:right-handed parallel beta-helix repeat-containing protein [Candidatus Uabimicrobium amorphum]|uniref:Right handed beta helix domain-containing protein n=1 Tax=Uabimicrobium amorphum TaxID=2596890 RepID=A0A5S9IHR4_UABAM|nr:right-handed parallel beta-helix repeat-containing protein [Candidatus Uabimicrobium amorphum]BBM81807.1 hypothetical protein UABAM_00146 [Candidatus Uabimicrobium amorphum]